MIFFKTPLVIIITSFLLSINFSAFSQSAQNNEGKQHIELYGMKKGVSDTFVASGMMSSRIWFLNDYRIELFVTKHSESRANDKGEYELLAERNDSNYCFINTVSRRCFLYNSFSVSAAVLDSFPLENKPSGLSEEKDTTLPERKDVLQDTIINGEKLWFINCDDCKTNLEDVNAVIFFDDKNVSARGFVSIFKPLAALYKRRVYKIDFMKKDGSEATSFRSDVSFGLNEQERSVFKKWIADHR